MASKEEIDEAINKLQTSETAWSIYEKGRAGYPAIYLVTSEDNRTQREIKLASSALNRKLYTWTEGTGLVEDRKSAAPIDDTEGPLGVLEHMKKMDKGCIVILRLFHHFLKEPLAQVKLLDVIPSFKINKQMLIITAPTVALPLEVEKEFALLESRLPRAAQLDEYITSIVEGSKLPPEFVPSVEQRKHLVDAALGLTTMEAENAITLSIIRPRLSKTRGAWDPTVAQEEQGIWDPRIVLEEKCLALKKSGLMEYIPASRNGLDNIGGLENLKAWIRERKEAFSDEAKKFGLTPPKGAMTLGPPGTGKTLTARAISGELGLPLLRLDMGKMYGSLVGQSEGNIRRAIETAEALAPCIVWIDEIEKGVQASSSGAGDSGVGSRVLGTLLTWMSDKTSHVFVYATANDISKMPPELLRKGRFDEIFFVDLPNVEERKEILRIHLSRVGRGHLIGDQIDIDALAEEATKDFTGAEIKTGVDDALTTAFHDWFTEKKEKGNSTRDISEDDLRTAFSKTNPLAKTMKEQINATRQWCESRARPANSRIEEEGDRVVNMRRAMQVD